jgi:hypothetical protein
VLAVDARACERAAPNVRAATILALAPADLHLCAPKPEALNHPGLGASRPAPLRRQSEALVAPGVPSPGSQRPWWLQAPPAPAAGADRREAHQPARGAGKDSLVTTACLWLPATLRLSASQERQFFLRFTLARIPQVQSCSLEGAWAHAPQTLEVVWARPSQPQLPHGVLCACPGNLATWHMLWRLWAPLSTPGPVPTESVPTAPSAGRPGRALAVDLVLGLRDYELEILLNPSISSATLYHRRARSLGLGRTAMRALAAAPVGAQAQCPAPPERQA